VKTLINPRRWLGAFLKSESAALLAAMFLALVAPSVWAAPTLVQKTSCYASSQTSVACTLSGVATGDTLIAEVGNAASLSPTGESDSSGDAVSTAVAYSNNSGTTGVGIYYVQNVAHSGTHTVTFSFPSSTNLLGFLAEYSGLATTGAFDKASSVAFSGGTSITTGSITPTNSGELVIFAVTQVTSGDTFSTFTNGLTQQGSNNSGPSGTWASVVTSSAISGGTTSNNAFASAAAIAAFVPSAPPVCTHPGIASNDLISVPNGTSGLYMSPAGNTWVTPDCSTVEYWSPPSNICTTGNFARDITPTGSNMVVWCNADAVPIPPTPQGSAVVN
jgi:hypothetical protein